MIYLTYKQAKFYYKILCIMGYTKIIKYNIISTFDICKVFKHEFFAPLWITNGYM
jgi:hypothetical protein